MSNTTYIILAKVKTFFKKTPWKKILTFLFFVFLSSIFWMMQVYRQKFEATLVIPIKYTNIPDSIVFDQTLPSSVSVRIKDDGASLFKYYFLKRNDSLVINLRDLISQTGVAKIDGRVFEQFVRSKLFVSSEIINHFPTQVSYSYAVLHQKKIPVIYDGYVGLASGYMIDGDIGISPDSVYAYGSKASLDTLFFAHTTTDTISNVNSSRKISVPIQSLQGIKFVPNEIGLSIPVDEFTQKEVDVPITCVNLPKNMNVKFFPSSVKVPIFVGLKRFNDINDKDFQVTVDYEDIKMIKDVSSSISIRITESPDYVRTKPPIPSEVEFVLEQE